MFMSARALTCIGHNTCLCRPQRRPTLGPASATIPVYVGQNCDLHQPQYLATSATTSVYIGQHWDLRQPQHLYTSATIPVYVGQNCDLHWPQYLATSATTSVYISQHWDLRRPHNCPSHWPVAFPDSRGPGNPTGSAQCNGPMCTITPSTR